LALGDLCACACVSVYVPLPNPENEKEPVPSVTALAMTLLKASLSVTVSDRGAHPPDGPLSGTEASGVWCSPRSGAALGRAGAGPGTGLALRAPASLAQAPCIARLNSLIPLPWPRAISGSLLGPNTTSISARIANRSGI